MRRRSNVYLATVDRALDVLIQFDEEHPEWSSSELAQALGLHHSIIYRILRTLERRDIVTRTDRGARYRLGLKLVELANVALANMDLREVAHPIMAQLVRETGESAFLTVVSDNESVCIDRIDSPQRVRVTLAIGGRYPLYTGASNKLLLAYLPSEKIDELAASGLKSWTPDTITDPARLKEDLVAIRHRGWAYSVGELTPGVACVAAPLWESNGRVVAALSIAGVASRFTEDRLPTLVDMTCRAADEISHQLLSWHIPEGTGKPQG